MRHFTRFTALFLAAALLLSGCSLSSAIACGLARGFSVDVAVRDAKAYEAGALAAGLNLGRGSGPLAHMWQYGTPMPC